MDDNGRMPCVEWAEKLADYHAHSLAPAEQEACRAHLETCQAGCGAMLAAYQQMDEQIHRALAAEPLPAFSAAQLSAQDTTSWRLLEEAARSCQAQTLPGVEKQARVQRTGERRRELPGRALLVGVNAYDVLPALHSCMNDALAMQEVLAVHEDGAPNFSCRVLLGKSRLAAQYVAPRAGWTPTAKRDPLEVWRNLVPGERRVTAGVVYRELETLFACEGMVLFYFSGHGFADERGVFLSMQDSSSQAPGVSLSELLQMANASRAREVTVIIDSCSSGALGEPLGPPGDVAAGSLLDIQNLYLRAGITLLASTQAGQSALEVNGHGIFTHLVLGALKGGASDVRGQITAASIYAYVDQALGPWEQRPVYKSNSSRFSTLRRFTPDVTDAELSLLPLYFTAADARYLLDPTYEVTHPSAKPEHVAIFKLFKRLQVARLLRPTGDTDLYFAALNGRTVELTPLGQLYWTLAAKRQFSIAPTAPPPADQRWPTRDGHQRASSGGDLPYPGVVAPCWSYVRAPEGS